MCRHLLLNIYAQILLRHLALAPRCKHDKRPRDLVVVLRNANHSGVHDGRMRNQQPLQLGRSYLQSFVLDQFLPVSATLAATTTHLFPVDNVQQPLFYSEYIPRLEPSIVCKCISIRLRILPVPFRDDRTFNVRLACFARLDIPAIVTDQPNTLANTPIREQRTSW